MAARKIKEGTYSVGAIDWDRRLFDELIPLPEGTSYNSYIVIGSDKTALIDTVDPSKEFELISNLNEIGVTKIDYVIANHAEQDHSGSIPKILEMFPEAKVVTNSKCKEMLKDLLHVPEEKFLTMADRQTLPLGGRTLEFILAPWVHWPETMLTWLKEDKILFPCDFLGSHLATDALYVQDGPLVRRSAKRYYAEIMMSFRQMIKKHIEVVKALDPGIIAPSHGPVYNNPKFILDAYSDWVSDGVKNEVVIPFVSMHASTREMVDYFVGALVKRGVSAKQFNLTKTDVGELAMALVDAATIVIGTPTVLAGAHPAAAYAAFLANALRPKTKFVSIIGSYGWGGRMVEQLSGMLGNLKVEVIPPVIAKGKPRKGDFEALDRLADEIVKRHSGNTITA